MHFVFYRTSDVFLAEEMLNEKQIPSDIVPTPVQDKAYCGVCLKITSEFVSKAKEIISGIEYQEI